jgi:flagellar motor switch protein FliN
MKNNLSSDERGCLDKIRDFFEQALSDSVSILLGETPKVLFSSTGAPQDQSLWFRTNFKLPPRDAIIFGGPKTLWLELGTKILESAEELNPDGPTILATLKELAMQVAGSLTSSVNQQYQRTLEAGEMQVLDEPMDFEGTAHVLCFRLVLPYGKDLPVTLAIPEELINSLVPAKAAAVRPTEAVTPQNDAQTKKLDLLLDVEMPVSVSLGRAQMALKDVVKLTTGSIVELSKNVSEPVDIVVNNCVVARGDVVVVEGNFGVRIKEVLSREDRLRRFGPK